MTAPFSSDGLMTVGLAFALLIGVVGVVALAFRRRPDPRWTTVAVLVITALVLAIFFRVAPTFGFETGLEWNWLGKGFAIGACLFAVALMPGVRWADVGLRLPEPGSLRPGLIAGAILCLTGWAVTLFLPGGGGPPPTTETLLYQASLPGLHEELFHRAIVTLLLDRALGQFGGVRIAGATLTPGAFASIAWFGLLHGIGVQDGAFGFSWEAVLMSTAAGFGLQWIYARTRSLLLPVLAHNLMNVGLVFL